MNKPHFDFRGNYQKYLPGVPPIPYFAQSVAYGRVKPKREAERGTREWDVCVRVEERRVSGDGGSGRGKGRSKGLMKRVL